MKDRMSASYKIKLNYNNLNIKLSTINQYPQKSLQLDITFWGDGTNPNASKEIKKLHTKTKQKLYNLLDKNIFKSDMISIADIPFDCSRDRFFCKLEYTIFFKTPGEYKHKQITQWFTPIIDNIYTNIFKDVNDIHKSRMFGKNILVNA